MAPMKFVSIVPARPGWVLGRLWVGETEATFDRVEAWGLTECGGVYPLIHDQYGLDVDDTADHEMAQLTFSPEQVEDEKIDKLALLRERLKMDQLVKSV